MTHVSDMLAPKTGENMQRYEKKSKSVMTHVERVKGGYLAVYAYPGMVPEYVTLGGEPVVYTNDFSARLAAFETMQERWNRHLTDSTRSANYRGAKPFPHELKEKMDDLWIDVSIAAAIEGTSEERVEGWLTGAQDIPFHLHWSWDLLAKEDALEQVLEKIRPHLSVKPSAQQFRRRVDTFRSLVAHVSIAVDEARKLADAWEAENAGEEHRLRPIIAAFDLANDKDGGASLNSRSKAIEEVAGKLGVFFDYNAEVNRERQADYRAIVRKRLQAGAAERKIKDEIKTKRRARLRGEDSP